MSREISRLLELFLGYEEDLNLKMLILKVVFLNLYSRKQNSGKQIRSLIQLAYKIERQVAGLRDTLGDFQAEKHLNLDRM
ncbi:hypothetical protein V6N13_035157 [Hibiscus sabdariffa]